MKTIFEDALNLPSRHSPSVFVPIYKLDLKTGEIELLLSEVNIEVDNGMGLAFLPRDSFYKNLNNNDRCYFFIFSKKYLNESSFNLDCFNQIYLDEILKNEIITLFDDLGYIMFCYYEDLINENTKPLFYKIKNKDLELNDIRNIYINLYTDEYIIKNNKEDEWIQAESVIRQYTNYSIAPNALTIYKLLENKMNRINELEEFQREKEKNKFINKVKKLIKRNKNN